MANLLSTGLAKLREWRTAHLTETATYTRGAASAELSLTRARTAYQRPDAAGFPVSVDAAEFIIATADLVLSGVATLPFRGDTVTVGGNTFELVEEPGLACYRYTDSSRASIRLHTKRRQ